MRPPWLSDEPEIVALLSGLLDLLDKIPADQRSRPVAITLTNKRFPVLFRLDNQADRSWQLIRSLESEHAVITLRLNHKRPPFAAEFEKVRVSIVDRSESVVRQWLGRECQQNYSDCWRQAVQANLFSGNTEYLYEHPIPIAGMQADQVIAALNRIPELASCRKIVSVRQLSALCFTGRSKVLDNRIEYLCACFPDIDFPQRKLVVNVCLPATLKDILFIENQDNYTAATLSGGSEFSDTALVYAAGFRGAAQRIRHSDSVSFHFHQRSARQAEEQFSNWWFENTPQLQSRFFGDLDFSGMAILQGLRQRFKQIEAWQPGYKRLLGHLQSGLGHRPEDASKTGQNDPGDTGCAYADGILLPMLRSQGRFIDQEIDIGN
ncbi:MAG: hypothetical protein ACI8P9_000444 [Parasphingorhabdus sp.]|jgi:hypothetical protein